MENISTHFETDIDNLAYITIERAILRYFDMGMQNTSNIPPEMEENIADTYILCWTRKSGKFSVSAYKNKSSGYHLSVSLVGKLHIMF